MFELILNSWKQSLSIFIPRIFLSFSKEALSLAWQAYKAWVKYFWWLVLFILSGYTYFLVNIESLLEGGVIPLTLVITVALLRSILAFIAIVAVSKKSISGTQRFFLDYWKHFLFLALLLICFELCTRWIYSFLYSVGQDVAITYYIIDIWSFIADVFIDGFFFILWIFFLLDSKAGVKDFGTSCIRALKFLWRTLPAAFLLVGILLLPLWLYHWISKMYFFGHLTGGFYEYITIFIPIPSGYPLLFIPIQYSFFAAFYARYKYVPK